MGIHAPPSLIDEGKRLYATGIDRRVWRSERECASRCECSVAFLKQLLRGESVDQQELSQTVRRLRNVLASLPVVQKSTTEEEAAFDYLYEQGRTLGLWSNYETLADRYGLRSRNVRTIRDASGDTAQRLRILRTMQDTIIAEVKVQRRRGQISAQGAEQYLRPLTNTPDTPPRHAKDASSPPSAPPVHATPPPTTSVPSETTSTTVPPTPTHSTSLPQTPSLVTPGEPTSTVEGRLVTRRTPGASLVSQLRRCAVDLLVAGLYEQPPITITAYRPIVTAFTVGEVRDTILLLGVLVQGLDRLADLMAGEASLPAHLTTRIARLYDEYILVLEVLRDASPLEAVERTETQRASFAEQYPVPGSSGTDAHPPSDERELLLVTHLLSEVLPQTITRSSDIRFIHRASHTAAVLVACASAHDDGGSLLLTLLGSMFTELVRRCTIAAQFAGEDDRRTTYQALLPGTLTLTRRIERLASMLPVQTIHRGDRIERLLRPHV